MREYQNQARIWVGAAVVVLAAQPIQESNTQVTGVQLKAKDSSFELRLETVSGKERSQISTVHRGKELVADILNTKLNLEQGQTFRQENPIPGIASVVVRPLDANSIRVVVSGETSAPAEPILWRGIEGITFSFTQSSSNQANLPIPVILAQTPISPSSLVAQTPTPTPQSPTVKPVLWQGRERIPLSFTAATSKQTDSRIPVTPTRTSSSIAQIPAPQSPTNEETPQPQPVVPSQTPDVLVPNPEITIDGSPAPANETPQPNSSAPPFLPRAVAPPVGDISISNINSAPELIDLGTEVRVNRLVLREAPIREVLALLARSAGLNLVFTDVESDEDQVNQQNVPGEENQQEPTVSLDLEDEAVQDVFNIVLQLSGFEANRQGNTILVGRQLPVAARDLITRSFRLNQAEAASAAAFLAGQGAAVQRIVTPVTEIRSPETALVVERREEPAELRPLTVPEAEVTSPLLLRGLAVVTDDRLNTITLVGEPRKVQIATSLLTQLDARRRQVAINVKVIDVNLLNTDDVNTSFSFGIGDNFFTTDRGAAVLNFGTKQPTQIPRLSDGGPDDPGANDAGELLGGVLPVRFLAALRTQITNGNAKILTDPTLVVQEGQEATVKLVQQVVTSVTTELDPESDTRTVTPEIGEAGLTLRVNIQRIDDNGFITLSVNPIVSAIGDTQVFESGGGAENEINLLNERELASGLIRLRDSQTLILSGIIQESDRTTVTKVPILGDIPILGALFRSTNRTNQRQEVIVLLTPQIIDDSERASFGYNYTPGQEAGEILREQGFPVPGSPE